MYPLNRKQLLERDVNTLKGIIQGIAADGIINDQEMAGMRKWIIDVQPNDQHTNSHIYRNLILYLREAIADGILTPEERQEITDQCDAYTFDNPYYHELTRGMQNLNGMLSGIIMDGVINREELEALSRWQEENAYLEGLFPFDEIYSMTVQLLNQDSISINETKRLFEFASAITNDAEVDDNSGLIELLMARNIYMIDPRIDFADKNFVITGVSEKHTRREITEGILSQGGIVKSGLSRGVDYLIVCANKNAHWAFSSYGRKIEAALKLRKQGLKLAIVHEFDLFDTIFD